MASIHRQLGCRLDLACAHGYHIWLSKHSKAIIKPALKYSRPAYAGPNFQGGFPLPRE